MSENSPFDSTFGAQRTPRTGARAGAMLSDSNSGSTTGMAGLDPQVASEHWSDDAHHIQRTPGAYEWWWFEAMDAAGNGVVVGFFEGLPFHPHYLRSTYHRQSNMKSAGLETAPRPELLASQYPAVFMGVYENGVRVAQFLNVYPPGSFEGSADAPELRVGPNRVTIRADGSFGIVTRGYPYVRRGMRLIAQKNEILSATLSFTPTFTGVQHVRPFRAEGPHNARHNWIIAAPHGRVTGRVQQVSTLDSSATMDLAISGLGYHDHAYGQGGLSLNMRRIMWGHAQGNDWAIAWHRPSMKDRNANHDGLVLFQRGMKPVVIEAPEIDLEQPRASKWFLHYPGRVVMHGSDAKGNPCELVVQHTGIMERSPFHVRLAATATFTVPGRVQLSGIGATNLLQIQRLRWPLMSDIVLMALHDIARDDPIWRE